MSQSVIRHLSLAAVALCFSAVSALAADLPSRKATAPAEVSVNWTGFYVGVHGALASGETGIRELIDYGFPSRWDVRGGAIGVQAGYNYQINAVVLGIEADYAYAAIDGAERGSVSYAPGTIFQTDMSSRVDVAIQQLITIRPRLGLAFDRSLIYVTAGAVAADMELRSETVVNSALLGTYDYSYRTRDFVFGWTIGAGLEHAFTDKLSMKAEYLLITLDRDERGNRTDEDLYQGHFFRVGLNYRF